MAVYPVTFGGGSGRAIQKVRRAASATTAAMSTVHRRRTVGFSAAVTDAADRPESVSRFSLFRSARRSEACWYRTSRSFSSALLMILSNSCGNSGFNRTGETGALCRIASKSAAVVCPVNGLAPVAISYITTPDENRSVRASSSSPIACSGDIYATVPTAVPGLVSISSVAA
jgi:hypothetical protein